MAEVVAKATEPALAAIKLAWWRERLQDLDEGKAPAEPRLQAAAKELLPRTISGASLAQLEEGWAALLDPSAESDSAMDEVAKRGALFFQMGSSLVGMSCQRIDKAGGLWALANSGRRCPDWPTRTHLFLHAHEALRQLAGYKFERELRPLTMLAALAARDAQRGEFNIELEATPGRALALLRHRLTGRLA